jgi:hypothetical protein
MEAPVDTFRQMREQDGRTVIVFDERAGDLAAKRIDFVSDNDGWAPPVFVFDAETGDVARPDDVIAVVLPCADAGVALAQATATYDAVWHDALTAVDWR